MRRSWDDIDATFDIVCYSCSLKRGSDLAVLTGKFQSMLPNRLPSLTVPPRSRERVRTTGNLPIVGSPLPKLLRLQTPLKFLSLHKRKFLISVRL